MGLRGGGLQGLLLAFGAGFVLDVLSGSPLGPLRAAVRHGLRRDAALRQGALPARRRARGRPTSACYVLVNWVLLRRGAAHVRARAASAAGWTSCVRAPGSAVATRARARRRCSRLFRRLLSRSRPRRVLAGARRRTSRADGREPAHRERRAVRRHRRATAHAASRCWWSSVWMLLLTRLFYLQVVQGDVYKVSAERNSVRTQRVQAPRGVIARPQRRGAGRLAAGVRRAGRAARDRGRADDAVAHRRAHRPRPREPCATSYGEPRGARALPAAARRARPRPRRARARSRRGSGRWAACSRR